MPVVMHLPPRWLVAFCVALLLHAFAPLATGQQPTQQTDVVKVNTDLVQTAVTVVDKNGHFVDGLTRDQFQLTIDGQPRPIGFFERISAGTPREAEVTRSGFLPSDPKTISPSTARGRTIVFFVDDLHLSADSIHRTRQMLQHFLDTELSTRDSVAIVSARGQTGFLGQFTRNKQVLTAAADRIMPVPYDASGMTIGTEKMTEYLALDIDSGKSDSDKVFRFYVDECVRQSNTIKKAAFLLNAIRATCETEVKNSARQILMQAGQVTMNTYASLDSLLRTAARSPGRKLAFFISDGFLLDAGAHAAGLRDKLDRIIDSAQRAGVVVYSIHAQGLVNNTFVDAANRHPIDPGGRLDMANVGELQARQDALNALAEDTGGRALRNTNFFDKWVGRMLDETSNYYLLAWRPDNQQEKEPKFRQVKVTIAGRPDLVARAPRGYVTGPSADTIAQTKTNSSSVHSAELDLHNALADSYSTNSLPTTLSLTYLNTPRSETVLTSSMQISTRALTYGDDGKQPSVIRVAGVILNDKGKIASSFKNELNVKALGEGSSDASVIYNQPTPMAPGIYQVRVAAREEKTGRVGSAMDWIVIPDLTNRQLTTSSVLLGGQVLDKSADKNADAQVQLSVDHRFLRTSALGYWIFVYNARRDTSGSPSLMVTTQVLRDGQTVVSSPQRHIGQVTDVDRIPFGEQLSLRTLAPGRYDLAVTITDTIAGATVTQVVNFEVV